jgi:16S rRNA processing protein RimM
LATEAEENNLSDQRGLERDSSEPRFLVIGQITRPHGVRGDVRVFPHTDLPERFGWLDTVYLGLDDPQPIAVENARLHKEWVILKLAGYDSRDEVESLRGEFLQVLEADAIPLEEDEYFLYQLEGLLVETDEGVELGTLSEILVTGANNVFVVRSSEREILLPDIPDVVQSIDFESKRMIVRLLPGLLDA